MRVPPPDIFIARAAKLRQLLSAQQLDALVVTSLPNIAYLTGFFASSAALIATSDAMLLIGDSRYAATLDERARDWTGIRPVQLSPGQSYDQAIVDTLDQFRGLRTGFEAGHLTVRRYRFLVDGLTGRGWDAQPIETDGLVESMRVRKDQWEVGLFREAAGRLSTVAKCILSRALGGRTESEVAAGIDTKLRQIGFDRPSFDTIVAAGPNAALPHARAGRRRIEDGALVVLDFGGVLDGYCTDMTRTVTAGTAQSRERRLIEQVMEAQAAAFGAIRSGVAPEEVDGAARDTLARHGIAEAFTHGTGHGLGLEVHEAPRITRARPNHVEPPLAPGMVLTLEPGVYYPGWGGVRIEDDVLVTDQGAEWLTR